MKGDPDTWWASLPRSRREQIYRWVEQPSEQPELPGQGDLFDVLATPPPRHRR